MGVKGKRLVAATLDLTNDQNEIMKNYALTHCIHRLLEWHGWLVHKKRRRRLECLCGDGRGVCLVWRHEACDGG